MDVSITYRRAVLAVRLAVFVTRAGLGSWGWLGAFAVKRILIGSALKKLVTLDMLQLERERRCGD